MRYVHAAKAVLISIACLGLSLTACDAIDDLGGGGGDRGAPSRSSSGPLVVPHITSTQQMLDLHATEGVTPEGATRLFLIACMQYGSTNTAEHRRGKEMIQRLSIEYMNDSNWDTLPTTRHFVEAMNTAPWIFRSYAVGANPENQYAIDPETFQLNIHRSEQTTHQWDLWLISGGADSPRRAYLKKGSQDDLYYLDHFGNLYVGIRQPLRPGEQTFQ